ncbi:RICIN domain-containing protein [Micromonospora fluostatini]|uniref:RICIN domain-containing protein n=1 Tax=Micromonospora sp. JCM 30529 TaxID=3421643 RepID=UPI003D179137
MSTTLRSPTRVRPGRTRTVGCRRGGRRRSALLATALLAVTVTTTAATTATAGTTAAAGAAAPLTAASPTSPPVVPAEFPGGWYEFRNGQTGQCLDGNGSGDIYAHPCNGGQYQQWHWDPIYGQLRQRATNRCLQHHTAQRRVTSIWLPCVSVDTAGTAWDALPLRPGTELQFSPGNHPGWCLDSNAEFNPGSNTRKVFLSGCHIDDRGQAWRYTRL